MVDGPILSPSYSQVPLRQLKRLPFPIVDPVGLLRQVDTFLQELIACQLGEIEGNHFIETPVSYEEKPKELLLSVVDKRFQGDNQRDKLYLSDVAALTQDVLAFLATSFPSRSEVLALRDSDVFKVLPLDLIQQDETSVSEEKAFERRRDLRQQIEALGLTVAQLLTTQGEATESQSINPQVFTLIQANPLNSWERLVLPLAKAYDATEENSVFVRVTTTIDIVDVGNYPAKEIPPIFNYFTEVIAQLIKQESYRQKLSADVIQKLENYSQQGFYFSDYSQNSLSINIDTKLPSYSLIVSDFIEFFDTHVIPYLLELKKKETITIGAVETVSDDRGGSDETAPPPAPPSEQPLATYWQVVRRQVIENIVHYLALQKLVLSVSNDLNFLQSIQNTLTQRVNEYLTDDLLLSSLNRLADEAATQQLHLLNETRTSILHSSETQPWLENFVQNLTNQTVQELQLSPEYVSYLISQLQVEQEIEPAPVDNAPVDPVIISDVRQALGAVVLAQLPPLETLGSESEWWNQLSAREKITALRQSQNWWGQLPLTKKAELLKNLDVPAKYETVLQSLTFDTLRDYLASQTTDKQVQEYLRTLPPETLINSEYYSAIQSQLHTYLLTSLTSDEFFSLFYSQDRLRVWADLRLKSSAYLQQFPEFTAYNQALLTHLENQDLIKNSDLLKTEVDQLNFERNVNVLLVVAKNPNHIVETLTKDKAKQYFGLDITTDTELTQLKELLRRELAYKKIAFQTNGLAETDEQVEELLPTFRSLAGTFPTKTFLPIVTQSYDSAMPTEGMDENTLESFRQETRIRRAFLENMWLSLEQSEKVAIYEEFALPMPTKGQLGVPPQLRLETVFNQYANRTQKKQSSVPAFFGRLLGRKKQTPLEKFSNQASNAATTAMNLAVPFSGTALKITQKIAGAFGIDTKKVLYFMGGLISLGIANTVSNFLSLGGLLGGTGGGVTGFVTGFAAGGPVGGALGGVGGFTGGSWAGHGIGSVTGLNTITAKSLLSKASSFLGTGTATLTPPLLPPILPAVTMVGIAVGSVLSYTMTESAFLKPLPTITGEEISKYVEIEKIAVEGNKFDDPTDITYEIRMRARDGYTVELTEAPKDEFSLRLNTELNTSNTTTLPDSPEYGSYVLNTLPAFSGQTLTTDWVMAGSYTVPFGSNPNASNYDDANVINTFSISFIPKTPDGQPVDNITEPISAQTAEVICFGECPQSQGGCWPTDGYVLQTTANESGTHAVIWAIDIRNRIGTPIYSTQRGRACSYSEGTGVAPVYGNHALVTTSTSQSPLTTGFQLLYGHMNALQNAPGTCSEVRPGQQLGTMGISGLQQLGPSYFVASNSHLHYEIRTENGEALRSQVTDAGLALEDIIPEGEMVLGAFVRSCYAGTE